MIRGVGMKKMSLLAAAVFVATSLVVPAPAANASSIYDAATASSLRNMVNAMNYYNLFGSTGSYEGATKSALQEQGLEPCGEC